MAEKRKLSTAEGGAKRIKALFSSFIRKGKGDKTEVISSADGQESQTSVTDASVPEPGDGTDGTAPKDSKPGGTPSRRSFRPLHSADFFDRVETFTAFGWFAKPWDLSPLHCARYGWENMDTDCLKCVSCREILCGELPALWERESYCQAYEKLKDSVKTSHSKICPWPASPSPESFLRIPLSDIKLSVESFHLRVESLQPLGHVLPSIDCSPIEEEERLKVDDLKSVLLKAVTERGDSAVIVSEVDRPVWVAACILAMFGWQKSQSDQTRCPVFVCQYCRRHAGLWNFTSLKEADARQAEASTTKEESFTNGNEDIVRSAFNPSTEHRAWCPWVRPPSGGSSEPRPLADKSSEAGSELPADLSWQQLMVALLKQTDPESYGALEPVIDKATTPPSQTWKAVRRILNIWQSKQTTDQPLKTQDQANAGDAS